MADGGGLRVLGSSGRNVYGSLGSVSVFDFNHTYTLSDGTKHGKLPKEVLEAVFDNGTAHIMTFHFKDERYEWEQPTLLSRELRNKTLFGAWYLNFQLPIADKTFVEEVSVMEYGTEFRAYLIKYGCPTQNVDIFEMRRCIIKAVKRTVGLWPVVLNVSWNPSPYVSPPPYVWVIPLWMWLVGGFGTVAVCGSICKRHFCLRLSKVLQP